MSILCRQALKMKRRIWGDDKWLIFVSCVSLNYVSCYTMSCTLLSSTRRWSWVILFTCALLLLLWFTTIVYGYCQCGRFWEAPIIQGIKMHDLSVKIKKPFFLLNDYVGVSSGWATEVVTAVTWLFSLHARISWSWSTWLWLSCGCLAIGIFINNQYYTLLIPNWFIKLWFSYVWWCRCIVLWLHLCPIWNLYVHNEECVCEMSRHAPVASLLWSLVWVWLSSLCHRSTM